MAVYAKRRQLEGWIDVCIARVEFKAKVGAGTGAATAVAIAGGGWSFLELGSVGVEPTADFEYDCSSLSIPNRTFGYATLIMDFRHSIIAK